VLPTQLYVRLDGDAVDNLQNSVALSLIRIQRETASGLVILVFNTVYAPFKPMRYLIVHVYQYFIIYRQYYLLKFEQFS
jgi:hypothetical protein